MEELDWKNGGFARYSVYSSDYLDAHITSSVHLKQWMLQTNLDISPLHDNKLAINPLKINVVCIQMHKLYYKCIQGPHPTDLASFWQQDGNDYIYGHRV